MSTTQIRLFIDFGIQFLLFVLLGINIALHPSLSGLLYYLSLFAIVLSFWQIIHAFYVVKKYKDWERKQYLQQMRQVLAYGLLTLGIGLFMVISSFGFLAPFFQFTITILHWVLCGVVTLLALNYFRISFLRLYRYYYRPRSFWDL